MSDDFLDLGLRRGAPGASGSPEPARLELEQRIALENRFRSGANWCYWIAGLSLVNSVASLMESDWRFAAALGITQICDAIALIAAQKSPNAAMVIHAVVIIADLGAAACFVLLGLLARQKKIWAFVAAMALYAIDSMIVLWLRDILGIAIHAFALLGLYGGMKACRQLLATPPPS
jgi:hypothetical protein